MPGVRSRNFGLAAVIVEMLLRVEFWIDCTVQTSDCSFHWSSSNDCIENYKIYIISIMYRCLLKYWASEVSSNTDKVQLKSRYPGYVHTWRGIAIGDKAEVVPEH